MSYDASNDAILFTSDKVPVGDIIFHVEVVSYKGGKPKMRAISTSTRGSRQCARFLSEQFDACVPLFCKANDWMKVNPNAAEGAAQANTDALQEQVKKLQAQLAALNGAAAAQ